MVCRHVSGSARLCAAAPGLLDLCPGAVGVPICRLAPSPWKV